MKMEFIFDENKLKKSGYTEEQCLNVIRKHFNSYKSNTIVETEKEFLKGKKKIGMLLEKQQNSHIQVGF